MRRLNIIGCGNVGKSLAKLWLQAGTFEIGHVLNRSSGSSQQAVDFIGGGKVASSIADLTPADAVMVSTSDDAIEQCAEQLAESNGTLHGAVVFNCSGAISSLVLKQKDDWAVGSIHPVKSFADPRMAVDTFSGTYCGLEGDTKSMPLLSEFCESINAQVFPIEEQYKTIYHSGAVIVCNYLIALIEIGLQCYEKAGIDRETAIKIIEPFIRGTIDNVCLLGTAKALTGPVARGETKVIANQCSTLEDWSPDVSTVYKTLGRVAVQLSDSQGTADKGAIEDIKKILSNRHTKQ